MAIFTHAVPFTSPVINYCRWDGKRFHTADSRKVAGIKHNTDTTINKKRHLLRFIFP